MHFGDQAPSAVKSVQGPGSRVSYTSSPLKFWHVLDFYAKANLYKLWMEMENNYIHKYIIGKVVR
jgi:hypothetical protein